MANLTRRIFIFWVTVMAASLWLLWLFDDGLGISWPANTLRNWHEFGLPALHGALVFNPGGFQAVTNPQVYPGMSPFYLYPVWFCTQLAGGTGLGTFAFYLVLGVSVVWGIWSLLGKTGFAQLVAVAVILSPGYGRWLISIDPNAISVLLGIPYAAAILELLKKPRLRAADVIIISVLTALFVPLNWTTAWVLAPFGVFLLTTSQVRRATAIKYLSVTAVAAISFVLFSMANKTAGSGKAGLGDFLAGYTWGNVGYGLGLTTGRACLRIFFVTIIGLMPVLVIWGTKVVHGFRTAPAGVWAALLPCGMALMEVLAMRNYFGHHPWMTEPVIIVGLIFSFNLLAGSLGEARPVVGGVLKPLLGTAAVCLIYGLAVVLFYRTNGSEGRTLINLVRHHTARPDWIVLVKNIDPVTMQIGERLDGNIDRHVVVVDDLKDLPPGQQVFLLTEAPINSGQLVAESSTGSGSGMDAGLQKVANWFNRTIAHRKPGDRLEFAGHYYLYRPAP